MGVIDTEFLWQTPDSDGNTSLEQSSTVLQPRVTTSEVRREKLSRYWNKKSKRNFGRKIKVSFISLFSIISLKSSYSMKKLHMGTRLIACCVSVCM